MKKILLLSALLAPCVFAEAQSVEKLDSAVLVSTRAGVNTPVAYSSVGKDVLRNSNPSNSLPMSLDYLPSVVSMNEGGTGLGNSSISIRGIKGSQINVTLNGVTLNDAESQEVFWVNIPSLGTMLSHVQVQRGLGTSANGAGAFGASINMNTAFVGDKPSGEISFSGGSFNTFIASLYGSTGLSGKGFYGSVSYNRALTDGYIRNAFVQSQSAFVALGWIGGHDSVRLTYLMGRQRSGITWDGISLEQYEKDRRYNEAGEYEDAFGNVHYYDNQTDNYAQHHLQLSYIHSFPSALTWASTLDYTRGDGYDEYYKCGKKLKNYGFPEDGRSDLIYQKSMGNDYAVLNTGLSWRSRRLDLVLGLNTSFYGGDHWGKLLWAQTLGDEYDYAALNAVDPWYSNRGVKLDGGAFLRAEYRPWEWFTAYAEVQGRFINYSLKGVDDDWISYGRNEQDRLDFKRFWPFFNPRLGVSGVFGHNRLFFSAAYGHREPGRADIKENVKGDAQDIRPEKMLDLELGYHLSLSKLQLGVNLYSMLYRDMLLETGRLSSSGYAIKENMPSAYRCGIELEVSYSPLDWLRLDANSTLSRNVLAGHTEYISAYEYVPEPYQEAQIESVKKLYPNTEMLLSPSVIAMGRLSVMPLKSLTLSLSGKYVGKQYLDNTSRDEFSVPAYFVSDLQLGWSLPFSGKILKLSAYLKNLFNNKYYASGWRWESYYFEKDKPRSESEAYSSGLGVYPQAPFNFMLSASLSF